MRHLMNFSRRRSDFSVFVSAFSFAAFIIGALPNMTNSLARAAGKGLDVEVPFEIKALKTPGLVAPYFLQDDHGAMVVSDQAGGVFSATSGTATIYSIDSSGKASALGTYNKPVVFELTTITFPPASDSKAANTMLIGMRAKGAGASKVGRIGMIGADGKMKDDVYLVGFIRPSGFAWSPSSFGSYGDELMIADTRRFASENNNTRDSTVYRVEKGIARPFAEGLMDPTDMKFIGSKALICDPAEKGKGQGPIVMISSLL